MEIFKELDSKELNEVNGGGPWSDYLCEKTKEFIQWLNSGSSTSTSNEQYSYLKLKMAGL
jgi:bacteriocin-like protein